MKPYSMIMVLILLIFAMSTPVWGGAGVDGEGIPRDQGYYDDAHIQDYLSLLKHRAALEPFNVVATVIFFLAIVHTMLTSWFKRLSHQLECAYEDKIKKGFRDRESHSMVASLLHLLGEVEVVFGIWAIALAIGVSIFYDWEVFVGYINGLHYTEPLFVIVIMTIASSRPIVKLFEVIMKGIVHVFGNTLQAWWVCLLIFAPLLGSFITEPAAMTIAAMLLADKFYSLGPSDKLKYVTLALLFVNVSIGGVLTNFAAPPVLMVASEWDWDIRFMLINFGWKAVLAISVSTVAYYAYVKSDLHQMKEAYALYVYKKDIQRRFISQKDLQDNFEQLERLVDKRMGYTQEIDAYSVILKNNIKELAKEKLSLEEQESLDIENAIEEKFESIKMEEMHRTLPVLLSTGEKNALRDPNWDKREADVPYWISFVHVCFLLWTVANTHEPVLFIAGFLFFLGFYQVTSFYQNRLDLKPALLVAFFLSGLMIHGTLQGWWIAPLLASLPEAGLNLTSIVLTAFNDNASITYLSTLVSDFPDALKYAVVSGAVTGGGLTIIANAPNPVGQSILKPYFKRGISAGKLLKYALLPTAITMLIFYVFK